MKIGGISSTGETGSYSVNDAKTSVADAVTEKEIDVSKLDQYLDRQKEEALKRIQAMSKEEDLTPHQEEEQNYLKKIGYNEIDMLL